jgi:hypothetical protein
MFAKKSGKSPDCVQKKQDPVVIASGDVRNENAALGESTRL